MNDFMPKTMRAIRIREPGGPEVLVVDEMSMPTPGPGEILVKVAAAGVNRPDVLQRQGLYPPPPGASEIPGLEIAGEVVAAGPGAARFRTGDRVCALVTGGGYAEYCLAPADQALPIPRGLSAVEAAAIPETFFTVWANVFDRCHLAPGESLLVHGGASGIGTTAIMLATALGSRVFATAGSPERCAACERLGAERAIDYNREDFVAVIKEMTDGRGVDVVLDMVAGSYIQRNLSVLAEDGRMAFIAFLGGHRAEVDFRPVMMKRLTVTGSTLRPRPVEVKAAIARALNDKVWPLIEAGPVRPVIDSTYPFDRAADAHRRIEVREHIGKIVLTMGE